MSRPSLASPPGTGAARPILSDASTTVFSSAAVYPARPSASPPPAPPSFSPPARPAAPEPPVSGVRPASRSSDAPALSVRPSAPAGPQAGAPGRADFDAWRAIVDSLRATHPRQASIYGHASLLQIGPERIVLGLDSNHVLSAQAFDASSRELLSAAARAHFKRPMEIVFENAAARGSSTIAQAEVSERRARAEAARRSIMEHPLVTAAIELLGAEIKDVRLSQEFADA